MKKNYIIKVNVLLSIVAVFCLITGAVAQNHNYTGAADPMGTLSIVEKPILDYSHKYLPPSGREGGETVATAIPIASLPFSDNGYTCDNINDYDETCPYSGSLAPDVVYSYAPAVNQFINIDLCGSGYDTKVFVYENGVGTLVGCNDDYYYNATCGYYTSAIFNLALTAGNTYYIVIDGYSGACGNYYLSIDNPPECSVCLSCSTPEGEPDIPDLSVDIINGGCNMIQFGLEPLFTPVYLNQVICGRSNTYIFEESAFRDTDWYEITLTEAGTLYWSGIAYFQLQLFILGTNCGSNITVYAEGNGGSCNVVTISANLPAGTYYLWAGPSFYEGMHDGQNYNVIATLNEPPVEGFCTERVPVPNWALFIGIGLILIFTVVRFRKMV